MAFNLANDSYLVSIVLFFIVFALGLTAYMTIGRRLGIVDTKGTLRAKRYQKVIGYILVMIMLLAILLGVGVAQTRVMHSLLKSEGKVTTAHITSIKYYKLPSGSRGADKQVGDSAFADYAKVDVSYVVGQHMTNSVIKVVSRDRSTFTLLDSSPSTIEVRYLPYLKSTVRPDIEFIEPGHPYSLFDPTN